MNNNTRDLLEVLIETSWNVKSEMPKSVQK